MFKHILKARKMDTVFMLAIYIIHSAANSMSVINMFHDEFWIGVLPFFIFIYSFSDGLEIVIDAILIYGFFMNDTGCRSYDYLHLAMACMKLLLVIAYIIYIILFPSFFAYGHTRISFQLILLAMYLHRFFILRESRLL
jgi:hypothetical protein